MKRTKLVVTLSAALAAVGAAAYALRPSPAASAPADAGQATLVAPALVEAHGDRVELAFETSGRITEVLADEGARVKAGDVVARLDDRIARARVAGAEAALAAAEARLDLAKHGARKDEIRAARADADAAAAQSRDRAQTADRDAKLLALNPDAITVAEVDATRAAAETADAHARAAGARLALLEKGSRKETITEAKAAVAAAAADLEHAQALLAQLELRAPSDGVVLRRLHEVGEQVSTMPPTTVLVIADLDHLDLRTEIDERDVAHIAIGQRGWATADAYGDRQFAGHVTQIVGELGRKTQRLDDPRARVDTRVQEVVFTLDESAALPLGLQMDVTLEEVSSE
jgi:multidrug resistance efflux pump